MCIISLKSNTYAQKVRNILRNYGMNVEIIRLEPQKTKHGCSYGISFQCERLYYVKTILNQNNIDYVEI
ncbi:MAG: DUF3343 domain-containing protein [Clostridia bacterium]|nr:DUF3343 domain-containing protein [Clostridia bacterium]